MTDNIKTIEPYEICMADKLGRGGFGTVYKGKHCHSGNTVAVKQCIIPSDRDGFNAMKEVKNFQQLEQHPNVVHLFDFYYRDNAFWFVMEFCNAGDLTRYMRKTNLGIDEKLDIMYQCASAIAYMHTRKNPVIHRDIKPANILLKTEHPKTVVKVTDFGLSKILDHDSLRTNKLITHAGTPAFMSPEQLGFEKYTSSVDVFALGLVYHCMLKFKTGDRELIPSLHGQGTLEMMIPVGTQLNRCIREKKNIPAIVKIEPYDDPKVVSMKDLIIDMTAALAAERLTMPQVERKLGLLAGYDVKSVDTSVHQLDGKFQQSQVVSKEQKPDVRRETATAQASAKNIETGDEEIDIMREALDKLIHTATSFVPSDVENEKKGNPYASLLDNVLGESATDAEREQLNPHGKAKHQTSSKIKQGDRVCVDPDEERVKLLQIDHGEYIEPMKMYLGREGLVRDRFAHVCKVQFDDGRVWTFNPEALLPTGVTQDITSETGTLNFAQQDFHPQRSLVEGMFSRYDIVKMPEDEELVKCLQHNHGGWNPKMKYCLGIKGIVNKIHSHGDVFVEFINGQDWTVNPEILVHVGASDGPIEEGDFVMVKNDTETVKRAQEQLGTWESSMAELLGKTGQVQSVNEGNAVIEIRKKTFIWSPSVLILVAKREELQNAARNAQASLYD